MTDKIQVTCHRCNKTITVSAKSADALVLCSNPSCGCPIDVSMPTTENWYYRNGSVVFGPLSSIALRAVADNGGIEDETLVRKGESGSWVGAKRVRGLMRASVADEDDHSQSPNEIADSVESDSLGFGADDQSADVDQGSISIPDVIRRSNRLLPSGEQVYVDLDDVLVTNKRLHMCGKTFTIRYITSVAFRTRSGVFRNHPQRAILMPVGVISLCIGLFGLFICLCLAASMNQEHRDGTRPHSASIADSISTLVCFGCGAIVPLVAGMLLLRKAVSLEDYRDPTTFLMIITTAGGQTEAFISEKEARVKKVARAVEEAMIAYE